MNCTLWLAAKKFLQENIRLMPHSENILMVSHLLLSTYLLFFMAQQQQKKKINNVIFFILAGKVSSISVQDVQDKVRGRTECFAAWQISGRGERVK